MSYEKFTELAKQNKQFEAIPTKTSLYAKGVVITNDGYIQFKGETYKSDTVKLADLPGKIRDLFIAQKIPLQVTVEDKNKLPSVNVNDIQVEDDENDNFKKLNKVLFDQLDSITKPNKDTDINLELKKANAICNIADKVIGIEDLALKTKMLKYKNFPK